MMRRFLFVLALAAAPLAACAKKKIVVVPPAPAVAPVAVDASWLPSQRAKTLAANPDVAEAWFAALASRGVNCVYMQTWDPRETDASWHPAFVRTAKASGMLVVAAVPLFLGEPGSPAHACERLLADGFPYPCSSPVQTSARLEALRRIRGAALLDVDGVCFTHAGFPSGDSDFSEDARFAFESALGRSVASWPADVAAPRADGTIAHGPLWDWWAVWRAGVLRDFMLAARAEADRARSDAGLRRVPVTLMANGLYPVHAAEGPNWADAGDGSGSGWSALPRGYGSTAVGQEFDAVVLEVFTPFATSTDAREAGMEWWSSCEGALAVARKATSRPLALAVAKAAWAGEDGDFSAEEEERWNLARSTLRALGVPVLLIE